MYTEYGVSICRHAIFAPSSKNAYGGATFPGLTDLLFKIDEANNTLERYEMVKRHFATIIFTIETGSAILQPVIDF